MSERLGIYSEVELGAARDFVRELVRVVRSHRLYEESHPALADMMRALRKRWDMATAAGPMSLKFHDRRILLADEVVYSATSENEVVPSALYDHGVVGLVLKRGIDPDEMRRLVSVLTEQPDGGHDYASLLWEADLKHVQVLLDADEDDEFDAAARDPATFAQEMRRMSGPDDPPTGSDFTAEAAKAGDETTEAAGTDGDVFGDAFETAPDDRFALTENEQKTIKRDVEGDGFENTIQHALRIVHALAREEHTGEDAETIENAIGSLTASLCGTGLLDSVLAAGERALQMSRSNQKLLSRAGEATLDRMRRHDNLWTLLTGLDAHEYIDMRRLGELFVLLGNETAVTVAEWLAETRHFAVAAHAVRVYGETAVTALIPRYRDGTPEVRERIAPILLDIGSDAALQELTGDLGRLPETTRLTVVSILGRSKSPKLREVLVDTLRDDSERVRRAVRGALKKQDAPRVADLFTQFLQTGEFDRRPTQEAQDFFEMLSRIGDGHVARLLADQCDVRGFSFGRRKLTELQKLCVRALRRMRSPDARPIVQELREHGPKAVRDLLDDVW